jgi:hypothetical protein
MSNTSLRPNKNHKHKKGTAKETQCMWGSLCEGRNILNTRIRNIWFPYFLISLQIIHSMSGRGTPSAVHLTVCPPPEPWWSSTSSRMDEGTAKSGKKSKSGRTVGTPKWHMSSEAVYVEFKPPERGLNLVVWVTLPLQQTHLVKSIFTVSVFWGLCLRCFKSGMRKVKSACGTWLERQEDSSNYISAAWNSTNGFKKKII